MSFIFSRRTFLGLSGLAAVGIGCGFSYANTTNEIELTLNKIPIPNLPPEFSNYRIGFLSDIHVSVSTSADFVVSAIEMLEKNDVDILLLGGDYVAINESILSSALERTRNRLVKDAPDDLQPDIAYGQLMSCLQGRSFRDGTIGVYGNHDHWISVDLCAKAFADSKTTLLCNQTQAIRRGDAKLTVIGTDDYWNGIPNIRAFSSRREPNETRILLTHNPDFTSLILRSIDFDFDLALSGHTHGGQICLPFVGAAFDNVNDSRLARGLYTHNDGRISYTTRGIGVVEVPYRINCPPEAAIFELVRA